MCGIFALLCCHPDWDNCHLRQVNLCADQWINRGPDGFGCQATGPLLLAGCVLHQRGPEVVRQPLTGGVGRQRSLLWNGELFACAEAQVDLNGNDTEAVGRLLDGCQSLEELLTALGSLGGPHAFIYYAADIGLLLFGRDLFGRRSLLIAGPPGHLVWSSIAFDDAVTASAAWTEVPAFGVFSLDLVTQEVALHPYDLYAGSRCGDTASDCETGRGDCETGRGDCETGRGDCETRRGDCETGRGDCETGRGDCRTRGGNFGAGRGNFGTGSEAHLIGSEADQLSSRDSAVQSGERGTRSGNSESAAGEAASVTSLCGRPVRLNSRHGIRRFVIDLAVVRADCPTPPSPPPLLSSSPSLDAPVWVAAEVDEFGRLLSEAVACRVLLCHQRRSDAASSVAVLFSGGVDSTLLAALAARHAPQGRSIDLLNVAFEQSSARPNPTAARRKASRAARRRGDDDASALSASSSETGDGGFDVPDRLTGVESVAELRRLFPGREFNFVTIDITLTELQDARARRISRLCRPCNTVLDDSLGCAVWFAARGVGRLRPELNPHLVDPGSMEQQYRSPCKVVLCGMGADELLCGYSRHRFIYGQSGYPAVADEVTMEIKRIAGRNLGRDDRMVSDHGREARFPYLDERLVSYLANLPPWKKADLGQDRGVGEKLLLRLFAWRVGLAEAALRPKRAMQFGSRIAKCESRRERGGQVCARLLAEDNE